MFFQPVEYKGNDGKIRRRQLINKALGAICLCVLFVQALYSMTKTAAPTRNDDVTSFNPSPLSDADNRRNRAAVIAQRYRSKGQVISTPIRTQRFQQDIDDGENSALRLRPKTDKEKVDLILSGKVYLVNIVIRRRGISEKLGYEGVQARFCYLDFSKYKKDPSSIPMFETLARSPRCSQTMFSYDLKEIVKLATAMDDSGVHAIEPSGFIFHESRCGSTLVANSLTAMNPEQHRVYSEARPTLLAMKACGLTGEKCPPHTAAELFQDVVYMMGRTREPQETKLFFKMQSLGTKYIDVVLEAFPDTPWIFVYRDPVQVMTSQFAHGVSRANCVRQLRNVPIKGHEFLSSIGRNISDLGPEERCAFHLSTLCDAAMGALGKSEGIGIGVNYENLVNKLITDIIPHHFNTSMTKDGRKRIIDVSGHYSKGRRGVTGKDWKEDNGKKERAATSVIREASETFLYQLYYGLESYEQLNI